MKTERESEREREVDYLIIYAGSSLVMIPEVSGS